MAVTGAGAHWQPPTEMFPWADPGSIRWLINYRKMDEPQVRRLLDAGFTLIQGGGFTPEAMQLAADGGAHRMMYICSRTIYHEQLFPKHPELRDAAILTPEGEYKVIYNNPARYAGCYNRPAWLEYIKGLMDEHQARGVDCIFFDNPMTWPCYCPTCRALFREYSLAHTGTAYELGAEGTPAELERWFTVDTATEFFGKVQEYAHKREKPLFIVANNLTYWIIEQGVVDGVFTEAFAHPPFGKDIAACKIGLAASHGRPTGFLSYIPGPVRQARGEQQYHAPGASNMWVALPVAEEYALGCATGIALGGNYMPNMCLNGDRNVLELTKPAEDQAILDACATYAGFARRWETLSAGQQPGTGVAVLFDTTIGPREGQILGLDRGNINDLLWMLQGQGIPAEVVVNSDLADGGLDGFSALIIDGQAMLSAAQMQGVRAFVDGGGTLVLSAALSIRERFESPDAARPVGDFLPGVADVAQHERSALDLDMDGYEPDGGRIKVMKSGTASFVYHGAPGMYTVGATYFDESDGQSTFEVLVDGAALDKWQATADDDEWHDFTSRPVELADGAIVGIRGTAGGGEYARLKTVRLRSATTGPGASVIELGRGRVACLSGRLQDARDAELGTVLDVLRGATPVSGSWPDDVLVNLLRQPASGVVTVHIVNHDIAYDEKYAVTAVNASPEFELTINDARLTAARLISPDFGPRDLVIRGGKLTVPPVKTYAAILLATDVETLAALEGQR